MVLVLVVWCSGIPLRASRTERVKVARARSGGSAASVSADLVQSQPELAQMLEQCFLLDPTARPTCDALVQVLRKFEATTNSPSVTAQPASVKLEEAAAGAKHSHSSAHAHAPAPAAAAAEEHKRPLSPVEVAMTGLGSALAAVMSGATVSARYDKSSHRKSSLPTKFMFGLADHEHDKKDESASASASSHPPKLHTTTHGSHDANGSSHGRSKSANSTPTAASPLNFVPTPSSLSMTHSQAIRVPTRMRDSVNSFGVMMSPHSPPLLPTSASPPSHAHLLPAPAATVISPSSNPPPQRSSYTNILVARSS